MKKTINHLRKLEPLVVTGTPGAYKILIFYLVQEFHSFEILGDLASWISIAQILGFFSAIGWSSLVLVRVSKSETPSERLRVFNELMLMSVLTMAACIVIMLILGATLELFNDAIQTSIWLAAWTFYQVPRHRFIALKQYQTILCVDAAISLLSVAFIALSDPTNLSEGIASIMLVGGLFLLLVIEISAKPSFKRIQMEPKGLEFGLMNFLGGGIMLSLVPLAAYFEGQEFAGAASMFMSIAAMALLIPRAISISSITTTSKLIDSPIKLREQTNIIRKKIKISSIAAATISALSGAVIITNHIHLVFWPNLAAAFALIILQNFFSTFGLAEANILTAKEESRTLLKINILAASSFLVAAIALLWIEPINSFIYLCAILAGLNFYRAQQNIKFTKAYLGKL